MLTSWNEFNEPGGTTTYKKKNGELIPYDNNIYIFDCETTNLFNIDGVWKQFDRSLPSSYYKNVKKASCVWFWQFSCNLDTFYGRNYEDFELLLKRMSDQNCRKIIWVFNLAFEFQQFMGIFRKYTITNMIARTARKPISFLVKELNIEFRCLYMLTGLSLENAAKKYTSVEKAVGDLDYEKNRSPLTKVTDQELYYNEMDLIAPYWIVRYYKKKYKSLPNIPFTQTGEVRRAFQKVCPFWHIKRMQKLIPSVNIFKLLWALFAGGYTHSNIMWTNILINEIVRSKDEASAYPAAMVLYKYPSTAFTKISLTYMEDYPDDRYAKIIVAKLSNVKAKRFNHIISTSKCLTTKKAVSDNGRLVCADEIELIMNEVDLKLYQMYYDFDLAISECYVSKKEYLPDFMIRFILELYCNKTKLKGVHGATPEDDEYIQNIYIQSKEFINSMYGCCVQNVVKSTVKFDSKYGWITPELTDDLIKEKLDEQKNSFSTLFYFAWGIWVTSYNRYALLFNVAKLDADVIYCDTDSIKHVGEHDNVFDEWNNYILQLQEASAAYNDIPIEMFRPKDPKGIEHPIGIFEDDATYKDGFKTLGAKKYAYMENSKVHITVSGVRKKAGDYLNNLDEFNPDTEFGYDAADKMISNYIEFQEPFNFTDIDGNEFSCTQPTGLCLQPTTYNMSITDEYEYVMKEFQLQFTERKDFRRL